MLFLKKRISKNLDGIFEKNRHFAYSFLLLMLKQWLALQVEAFNILCILI